MRRRPLRKISCHPFLKIFVNLVSSVCGFISTCINVSSLVTEPQYLEEDIIKNVFGPWGDGGREADEVLLPGEQGALRGMGRAGGGGESRKEEEGEGFPLACRALSPGSLWNAEPAITAKLAEECPSPLRAGVGVCRYLFNGTRSTDSAGEEKLVSLLTTH